MVKSRRCLHACHHQLVNFFEEYCDQHIFVSALCWRFKTLYLIHCCTPDGLIGVHTNFRSVVARPPKRNVGVFSRDVKREPYTDVNCSILNTLCQNSAYFFPGSIVLTLLLTRWVQTKVKVAISGTFSDQSVVGCRNFPDIRLLHLLCILVHITTS
jgi:hypothetical protein